MNSLIKTIQFTVILLMAFCTDGQKVDHLLQKVDLESNIQNFKELSLSQINAGIHYQNLKNNESINMNYVNNIDFTSDLILVSNYKYCILYDHKGDQVAKIYEKDRSENEKGIILGTSFGEKNNIYIQSTLGFLEFDRDGSFIKSINCNKDNDPNFYFSSWKSIDDSLIFAQIPNSSGHEKNRAILFDLNGNYKSVYKNYIILNRPRYMFTSSDADASFHCFNGKAYFKEFFNDTLFCLTKNYELIPELVFNIGKYAPPKVLKENLPPKAVNPSGYVFVQKMFESSKFLMIDCNFGHNIPAPERIPGKKQWYEASKPWYNTLRVLGLYNKADRSLIFSTLTSTANTLFTTGFYNDVDAGPRFYPLEQINDSTFVMAINSKLFKDHIASNDFKNNLPKFPEKKKYLEEFANRLTDSDNLILMYLTIK